MFNYIPQPTTETLEYSFDAYGRRRDKDDWSYTLTNEPALFADRGFTGTRSVRPCLWEWSEPETAGRTNPDECNDIGKHLEDFHGLINMNGRLGACPAKSGNPQVGRFLSPDNYVQNPFFTQNYNRYSYCINNPLKYTDPSGETYPVINKDLCFDYSGIIHHGGGGGGGGRFDFSGYNARADAYFGIVRDATGNYLFNYKNDIASTNDPTVIEALLKWSTSSTNAPPPSPSSGNATNTSNDKCGNDFSKMFKNLSSAEKYLKDNASCNKEKFFYINTDGSVLVGPWYDALPGRVSKQYADLFQNGLIVYKQTIYKVEHFAHTHPDHANPSKPDGVIYDYFSKWGINTLIYYNYEYYYHTHKNEGLYEF